MVKKRPSKARTRKQNSRPAGSKAQPRYWRHRLFRNTFTHRGKRFEINHWSVKIQHRGTRKTFSFRGRDRDRAAREACQLYQSILEHGWHNLNASHRDKEMAAQARRESSTLGPQYGLNPQYWAQRLVHRKYTETLHPAAGQELSVC